MVLGHPPHLPLLLSTILGRQHHKILFRGMQLDASKKQKPAQKNGVVLRVCTCTVSNGFMAFCTTGLENCDYEPRATFPKMIGKPLC